MPCTPVECLHCSLPTFYLVNIYSLIYKTIMQRISKMYQDTLTVSLNHECVCAVIADVLQPTC